MIRKTAKLLAVIILVIILGVLVFIHTPFFESMVRHDIEEQVTRSTGEPLTIGDLSISPFSGRLIANDVQLAETVQIERVFLDVNVWQLFLFKIVVNTAEVDGVHLNLVLAPQRTAFQTNPLELVQSGFDTILLKDLQVRDLNLSIRDREDMSVTFEGSDFLLQSGFDGKTFAYKGTVGFSNGNVTVNGTSYLLNMGCAFSIRKDALEIRELTLTRGQIRLALSMSMTAAGTRLKVKGSVPLKELTGFPEISETLAEFQLEGTPDELSGPLMLSDPRSSLTGILTLNLKERTASVHQLTGTFRDHTATLNGSLVSLDPFSVDARIDIKGPLLRDFTADVELKKKDTWQYRAEISGTDCGGGECRLIAHSGEQPSLDDVRLRLPFMTTDIQHNRGMVRINLDWLQARLDGEFFGNSWFDGLVQLNHLKWEEMTVPSATGRVTVNGPKDIRFGAVVMESENGQLTADGSFTNDILTVEAELNRFPLHDALFAVPETDDLDISGRVSGHASLKGLLSDPVVSGDVTLSGVKVFDILFDRAASRFRYENEGLSFDTLRLENGVGTLAGSGSIRFDTDSLTIQLEGDGLDIRYLPVDFITLHGSSGTVQADGTLENPQIRAGFRYQQMEMEGVDLGGGTLDVVMNGTDVQVTTETDHQIRTRVAVDTDGPMSINLTMDNSPVSLEHVRTTTSASFSCTGNFLDTATFQGQGIISHMELALPEDITLVTADAVPLKLDGMRLSTDSARLEHPNLALNLKEGSIVLDSGDITGKVTGSGTVAPFAPLVSRESGVRITGTLRTNIQLSGSIILPGFTGILSVADGTAVIPGLDEKLTAIAGTAEFDPAVVTIRDIRGRYGSGSVSANGIVSGDLISLNGALESVPLDMSGIIADVSGLVQLQGNPQRERLALTGNLTLEHGLVNPRQMLLSGTDQLPILEQLQLDLSILTRRIEVADPAMALFLSPSTLQLVGPGESPVVLGTQRISPDSTIYVNDIPMRVKSGSVRFENRLEIDPEVDLVAETQVQGYTVRARIRGTGSRVTLNLSSTPPLQERELMALLFGSGGISTGDRALAFAGEDAGDLTGAGVALALNNLFAPFQRKVRRRLGVERFSITPQMFDARSTPSPIVTFEKDISSRLTGTYSQSLIGSGENLFQFRYDMAGRKAVVARKEIDGSITLELEFQR